MDLKRLFELNDLATEDAKRFSKKREIYAQIAQKQGRHFIGIAGPRGAGKTVLLRQLALNTPDSFYISLDTLDNNNLFEIAKTLVESYGIHLLLLDEVHFLKNYDKELKQIFDFLDLRVVFTSSVSLSIFESSYDLSRRARVMPMYPFSMKEYLYFKKDISVPALSLNAILDKQWDVEHLRHRYLFDDYLQGGLFPFSIEDPDILPAVKNILHKIVQQDIPSVANLRNEEIPLLAKLVEFIGKSPVDGINFTTVAKNVGITKYKAEQYIHLLEKAFVLNPVFPKGTNVLREPKVLMWLPFRLLYNDFEQARGALREDFFAEMMRIRGQTFHYLKSTRGAKTPDFLLEEGGEPIVIEVGGKGKGREQFKGISAKKKLVLADEETATGIKRPLFLLGYA